ncbi:MAG TPA: universal stress protein [Marmoricola sp.]|nr:universal stress protein [Marmoricola sp.]
MQTNSSAEIPAGGALASGALVVGVDGSPASDRAVEWAAARAADTGATLLIAHACGEAPVAGEVVNREEGRRLARAAGRKIAGQAAQTARAVAPDLCTEVIAPLGDPRELLLELSEGASMVVVGTRGRGPIRSLLLGSVSSAVASHAHCPVVVVRAGEQEDHPPRPVVAGVDCGPRSDSVLGLAFELAETEGRPLEVLHSWQVQGPVHDHRGYVWSVRERSEEERQLEEMVTLHAEKHPDVHFVRHVVEEDPVAALVERSAEAALVVVGSRGRSWARSVMGSVSRAVVERAHCAVVVIRP